MFKTTDKNPRKSENDGNVDVDEHNMVIHQIDHFEYESDVDFKHLTPMPGLVDVKPVEEDEKLFGERAKLYRMDTESKTWMVKGLGELKLLKDKKSGRVRIIMICEKVLTLFAIHNLTDDMTLKKFASSNVAWCWLAQDYAGGVLKNEQFAAQFETPELAQMFKDTFEEAQRTLATTSGKPKSKDMAAPKSGTTSGTSSGFSDKVRPKADEWSCNTCLCS